MTALSHLGERDDVARTIINPFAVIGQSVQIVVEGLLQIVKGGNTHGKGVLPVVECHGQVVVIALYKVVDILQLA